MKRELFNCDYCTIERFNSETQEFINLSFSCETLAHWKQHITRPKHNINIARNNNLEANLVVECKSCNGIFTNSQYTQHRFRNQLLWITKDPIYKDCSCNNFVYGGKRFENLNVLKAYAENRYDSGRKKNDYIPKPKTIKSFADRAEPLRSKMKAKEAKEEKEDNEKKEQAKPKQLKETKIIGTIEDEEFIQHELQMNIVEQVDDEFNELNNINTNDDKSDFNIKPLWDEEDMCYECGKPDNSFREYPIKKLENWDIDMCNCEDSDTDED